MSIFTIFRFAEIGQNWIFHTGTMLIPFEKLSAEALRGVIEDYVLREGTDYGDTNYSLDEKIEIVTKQLEKGSASISFDEETETCSIVRV